MSKDLDGIISSWNKAAEKMFGYTAEEVLGRPVTLIIPTERLHEADRIIESIRRGECIKHFETQRKHRDGRLIDVSLTVSPVRDDAGGIIGASKVLRDISDQKHHRELRSLLASVVDSSDDAIVTKDLNSIITSWNAGAECTFGYKAEEVIGRPIWLLFPPDRIGEETAIVEKIKRGERVDHFETVRMHKDGRLLDISVTISPVKDDAGRVIGASKIARDIGERKRAERALLTARMELEHANEQLARLTSSLEARVAEKTAELEASKQDWEAFAYSVSHDLRGHLRALTSFSELLREDASNALTDEQKGYLERIGRAATRMQLMVDGVLAFTRVVRSQLHLRPVNVDHVVADLINSTPELRAPAAHLRIEAPLGDVLADLAGLHQCLANLLNNAAKYVAPGRIPEIVVCSEPRGEFVRLWVEDKGIGIAEDEQRNLFQLFQRMGNTRAYAGTGLGLAIVRRAAERMGGSVGVESRLGEGSSFWLELKKAHHAVR